MPSTWPIPEAPPREAAGILYVVATPIGNLADISLRALEVLGRADLIAAEDTRHTRKLLTAHKIRPKKLISYHEHNERERAAELLAHLAAGATIALVSDAGSPAVSDPGYRLVAAAAARGLSVAPIPGPSAAIAALSAGGLPTDAFTFVGFPARKKTQRDAQLRQLAALPHTLIFYESPRRVLAFLKEAQAVLGDRPAVLAREMTKHFEEFLRGRLSEILARLASREEIRGECTLLVGGTSASAPLAREAQIHDAMAEALAGTQRSLPQLSKELAKRFGRSKQEIYTHLLRLREKG